MAFVRRAAPLAALAAFSLTHPAAAQQSELSDRDKIELLEQRIKRLEELLEQQTQAAPPAVAPVTEPTPTQVADDQAVQQRLESLDQDVKVLQRKQELQQEEEAAAKKERATVTAADNGLTVRSADGKNQFRLRGLLQTDGRFFFHDSGTDTFLLRRVRPIFEGTLYGIYDFRFTPDFGGGRAVVQDAYVDARFRPYARLRVGKFKEPVGLERLQSGSDIKLVERAFPTNLLPNRDIGLQLHGELLGQRLEYQVGLFNGAPDGRSSDDFASEQDNNSGKDVALRVFSHPFRDAPGVLQGFGVGIAVTYADFTGSPGATVQDTGLPSYRTPAQQVFFTYRTGAIGTFANGTRARLSPQAYWYWRQFGVLAEYASVEQEVSRTFSATDSISDKLHHEAWQVQLNYVVSGEDASFRGIKPRSAFEVGQKGWGALELVARYSEMNLDNATFTGGVRSFADPTTAGSSAKEWSAGLNWYLNTNLKVQFDYSITSFSGGGGGTLAAPLDRPDEELIFGRFQLAF